MTDDKDQDILDLEAELDRAEDEIARLHEELAEERELGYLTDAELAKAQRVNDSLYERLDIVSEAAMAMLVMAERSIERDRCSGAFLDKWDEATSRLGKALSKDADVTPAGISWRASEERVANVVRAFGLPEKTPDSEMMQIASDLLLAADENNRITHKVILAHEDAMERLAKIKAAPLAYMEDITLGEGDDAFVKAMAELDSREETLKALCADDETEVEA